MGMTQAAGGVTPIASAAAAIVVAADNVVKGIYVFAGPQPNRVLLMPRNAAGTFWFATRVGKLKEQATDENLIAPPGTTFS